MWKANKIGILTLLIGLVALGGAHLYLLGIDAQLAKQVLSVGICLLLFSVATGIWLSVRRELSRHREE